MGAADDYVLKAPGTLSHRAIEFLRSNSRRVDFDRGYTGDRLRQRIVDVYGGPNDEIIDLLDRLQSRYGGLTYLSGFFESDVLFGPVCEPDDAEEDLEILYAVQTGSPVGASVKSDGSVEIGLDQEGVAEFVSLDALIECDSMFFNASSLPVSGKRYLERASIEVFLERLQADKSLDLVLVDEASGAHSVWLEGESKALFVSAVWGAMGLPMPPFMFVAAGSEDDIERIATVLGPSQAQG
jgi:hypothetical protein